MAPEAVCFANSVKGQPVAVLIHERGELAGGEAAHDDVVTDELIPALARAGLAVHGGDDLFFAALFEGDGPRQR